jgi:hypothetical protein
MLSDSVPNLGRRPVADGAAKSAIRPALAAPFAARRRMRQTRLGPIPGKVTGKTQPASAINSIDDARRKRF